MTVDNVDNPLFAWLVSTALRHVKDTPPLCYFSIVVGALLLLLSKAPTYLMNVAKSKSQKLCSQVPKRNELSKERIEMIASRNWKSVLAWATFHPNELKWVDRKSQTVLHHACLFRAPAQVVDMLLFQAPELARIANRDGELPLHWAVRLSAPNEVLKLLLTANPTSGITAKDKEGETPLSILWDRHQESFLEYRRQGREKLLSLPSWKRVMLFLQMFETGSNAAREGDDRTAAEVRFLPLHIGSRCSCPPAFFTLLTLIFPEEAKEKDDNGNLPLAVACSDPIANRSYDVHTKIQMLISIYPEAIRVTNAQGRLPMFIALEAGVLWEEGVSTLFEHAPESISLQDPVTRLYPFMLAASTSGKACFPTEDDSDTSVPAEEAKSLSTVFMLLRADPTRVSNLSG